MKHKEFALDAMGIILAILLGAMAVVYYNGYRIDNSKETLVEEYDHGNVIIRIYHKNEGGE